MVSPLLSEQPICDTPRSERGLLHLYKIRVFFFAQEDKESVNSGGVTTEG